MLTDAVKNKLLNFMDTRSKRTWNINESILGQQNLFLDSKILDKLLSEDSSEDCFLVVDNFFDDSTHINNALLEAQLINKQNNLKQAGVGTKSSRIDQESRGDSIIWLHRQDLSDFPNLRIITESFKEFASHINKYSERMKEYYLQAREIQLAYFPSTGTRFIRHKDSNKASLPSRLLTAILYINSNWTPKCGGQLMLHTSKELIQIPPISNRFVLFRSDVLLHEVLENFSERYAITCWIWKLQKEK